MTISAISQGIARSFNASPENTKKIAMIGAVADVALGILSTIGLGCALENNDEVMYFFSALGEFNMALGFARILYLGSYRADVLFPHQSS